MDNFDKGVLVAFVAFMVALFSLGIYMTVAGERECAVIETVGSCNDARCRVELESGSRRTVRGPVMVGDEICWRKR